MTDQQPPSDPGLEDKIQTGKTIKASWGGPIGWFAHNHVAANILMMLLVVGGLISVSTMRTETFPQVDPRLITVSVSYPGATPYEIEESITSRSEEAVSGINGIKRIHSTAMEGAGVTYIELEDFINADDVYNDVETAIDGLSDFPPEEAERPIVKKSKNTPDVIKVALHGDVDEYMLKYWTETLDEEIRQLPGIALTSISGVRDAQISVEISEKMLRHYEMTLEEVTTAIENNSIDIPAGTLETRQGDIALRVQQKRYTAREFAKIPLRTLTNGATLYLGDVAKVVDGFSEDKIVSHFNGQRASFITVRRSETEDTLKTANTVKEYLTSVKLPEGLEMTLQQDRTEILKERINLMLRNAILGFALVFLVLLLFLDLKLAFWTSAAIPVSFLGGLMIIHGMGYSINMVSLFALIVVLGIVVDDAIVMGESIFDAQEKYAKNPNAVMHGVKRVIAPVSIGVFTTMAAFAPLIFSTGTFGQIIKVIPIAVIPILCVSLVEAFFILPAHLDSPKRWSKGIIAKIRDKVSIGLETVIHDFITPLSIKAMSWRYVTIAIFIAWFIITIGLFTSGTVRFIFFPKIEGDNITIALEMPSGTPFATTEKTMGQIEAAIDRVKEQINTPDNLAFKNIEVTVGQQSSNSHPGAGASSSSSNNLGQIQIELYSSGYRKQSASEIESLIRKEVGQPPGIETLSYESGLMGTDADIELELSHYDESTLNEASEKLKEQLAQIKGTQEIADSFEPGKAEYVYELTAEGLAAGLTAADLGRQLRSAFFGAEAQRLQRGRNEVIVYVRYPKDERESISALNNARIRLNDGTQVPLSAVATRKEQTGYSTIHTVDGRRIISVTADVDYAQNTPNNVIEALRETILPTLQERYPGLSYSFEGETKDQRRDLSSLGKNMLIALLLIYVLLGAQLRSYIQPLIIMSAIPFGIAGAIWGHMLLGYDLSFISMFGIVALSGVVVNDSIVLVDYFNMQKQLDHSTVQSALNAVQRRFRPILLTTLTTSLGLLPMLLETSLQARFLIPMVISLAIGILFSTVIILFLIPALLLVLEDIKRTGHRLIEKIMPTPQSEKN